MGVFRKDKSAMANLKFHKQEARRILDNPDASQSKRDKAAKDLQDAYDALTKKGK